MSSATNDPSADPATSHDGAGQNGAGPIRMIHLADVHLGYTGPANLTFREGERDAGRYVREVDIERALKKMTNRIIAEAHPSVDLVVVAGDLFHRSAPLPTAVLVAAGMVRRLADKGIDVVIIDGNHETSTLRHTGSPTGFLAELGAHVVNGDSCKVVRDGDWHNPRLQRRLAVHALPYGAVLDHSFDAHPIQGYINVLVAHGRVQGMPDEDSIGKPVERISPELLRRGWDYVALGDWHMHMHKPLDDSHAYYAGSVEAINFGEASRFPPRKDDSYSQRGAVDVRLAARKAPLVSSFPNDQARPVLSLEPVDAVGLDHVTLLDAIRRRFASTIPTEALVRLEVRNCSALTWERIDRVALDEIRKRFRLCRVEPSIVTPEIELSLGGQEQISLDQQWQEFMTQAVQDEGERGWYTEHGLEHIESARRQMQRAHAPAGES